MHWFEQYIGKPWSRLPEPPHSFTCGELVRHIYKDRLNVETPIIYADPARLAQCIRNLEEPEAYGFHAFSCPVRPFDIAYLLRRVKRDHVGLVVRTGEGLMILHCLQGVGVVLETEAEIMGSTGARRIEWRRHQDVSEELALCKA